MIARSKVCAGCGLRKVAECFWRTSGRLQSKCKPCHREAARQSLRRRYAADPERFRVANRAWKRANLPQRLAYNREWKRRIRDARREEAA